MSRRQFLKSSALFSSAGLAPMFLTRSVSGATLPINGFKDDRVLVVVQLSGGNDGLNTVVPYSNDEYYRSRPSIGLKEDRLLKINDDLAFNDKLEGLMRLYDDGKPRPHSKRRLSESGSIPFPIHGDLAHGE